MRRLTGISTVSFTISACAIGWGAAHPGWSADHRSVRGGNRDHCCSHMRSTRTRLVGKASKYRLVGKRTASGEILDTVTPTAAHRSLPLGLACEGDEPPQRALCRRQDQRSRSIRSRAHR
jgi:hypothetical protein